MTDRREGPRTDWDTTSFSELHTLAECEMKHDFKYRQRLDDPSGDAAQKGTLVHSGINHLFAGQSKANITDNILAEYAQMTVDNPTQTVNVQVPDDALWLIERYRAYYGPFMRNVEVLATEVAFAVPLPFLIGGQQITLKGKVDNVYRIQGREWAVERKTMGDWSRLDLLEVDPQLTLYDWALKEAHRLGQLPWDIYGILFDAIRTYRWKLEKPTQKMLIDEQLKLDPNFMGTSKARTEWAREAVKRHPGVEGHEPGESFDQQWLDRTPRQHEEALAWAQTTLRRRHDIQMVPGSIRNIGPFCKRCPYKEPCFEQMAFGTFDIEVVE